jgi:hypothetical protein
MSTRTLLGAADVDDDDLATMVASLLGEEQVAVLDVEVCPVDYDLAAITTAGRHWVSGHAETATGPTPFRIFVKQVQCWSRSPLFEPVPPEIRDMAAAGVPWRTEPLVYRSDLAARLPEGLSMPSVLGVFDLDELSASIWLAEVPAYDWPWDLDRYRRAAYLLGRLAGSQRIAPLADIGEHAWTVRDYVNGRFRHQVVPMLRDDDLWTHPLLADAFGPDLRERMRDAALRVPSWVEELAAAPHLPAHGDACPNNLLGAPSRDDFILIDFGFWKPLPLGFDLGQLVLGDVQLGRRPGASLAETDAAVVPAYVEGLAVEGMPVDPTVVRRLHALQMLIFSGLSSMPFEHLDAAPSPKLTNLAADRAALATYCLNLAEATGD